MLRELFILEMRALTRRVQDVIPLWLTYVVSLFLFSLAFEKKDDFLNLLPSLIFLLNFVYVSLQSAHIFIFSQEPGYLAALVANRSSLESFLVTRMMAYWVILTLPLIGLGFGLCILFGVSFSISSITAGVQCLSTLSIVIIGTIPAALTAHLRKEYLVTFLMLPLLTPTLLLGLSLLEKSQQSLPLMPAFAMLGGLLMFQMGLCLMAGPAALKIGVKG